MSSKDRPITVYAGDQSLRAWGILADWLLCPFKEKNV